MPENVGLPVQTDKRGPRVPIMISGSHLTRASVACATERLCVRSMSLQHICNTGGLEERQSFYLMLWPWPTSITFTIPLDQERKYENTERQN